MNKITILLIWAVLSVSLHLKAQPEYRFTGEYMGTAPNGLRSVFLDIQVLQSGAWKRIHRGTITTGRNLDMATVETDTVYSAKRWNEVMADSTLKQMYLWYMDAFLNRIEAADITPFNTPVNTTSNTITLDKASGLITVQVRGVEGDNRVWITLASLDNHYMIFYNKQILPYSANLIDLGTSKLQKADYIVQVVPNKGSSFSGKVVIE